MFKDLPLELELEILVRVPATSLTHLKSTCKRWYVLLKERFIEKNMGKGARQFILKKDGGVYSVSIGLDNSFEFTSKLTSLEDSEPAVISTIHQCDHYKKTAAGYEAQKRLNQQMMEMMQRMYPNKVFPNVPDPDSFLRIYRVTRSSEISDENSEEHFVGTSEDLTIGKSIEIFRRAFRRTGGPRSFLGNFLTEFRGKMNFRGVISEDLFRRRPVVWNPCTSQTRWIQPSNRNYKNDRYLLGYENDNKSFQNYKIMRSSEVRNEFGIYDFNSDSWRLLDRLTHIWFIRSRGVSLKGSIYWVAWDRCKPFTRKYLVRFDFKREIFERLSLPFRSNYFDGEFSLSVVREERLSVFLQKFSEMKIWVMDTKIDEAKSTNIQYSLVVDFSDIWSTYMSSMVSFENFLVDEETKKVVLCGRDGNAKLLCF
uniref:F-box domain-containing protein n=1 Tax=Brassica oleracea var. oleracea TaxID=109376 RepID=A0A0D3DLR5_BRAOL